MFCRRRMTGSTQIPIQQVAVGSSSFALSTNILPNHTRHGWVSITDKGGARNEEVTASAERGYASEGARGRSVGDQGRKGLKVFLIIGTCNCQKDPFQQPTSLT